MALNLAGSMSRVQRGNALTVRAAPQDEQPKESLTPAFVVPISFEMAARSDVNRAPYRSGLGAIRGLIFFEQSIR
jgi:hypothetical protein